MNKLMGGRSDLFKTGECFDFFFKKGQFIVHNLPWNVKVFIRGAGKELRNGFILIAGN